MKTFILCLIILLQNQFGLGYNSCSRPITEDIQYDSRNIKDHLESIKFVTVYPDTTAETCDFPFLLNPYWASRNLSRQLKAELFGQHLVHDGLLVEIYEHITKDDPPAPLTISLQGWPGSGKSYTAEMVTNALYYKKEKSKFVKFFTASYHFPDPSKLKEYQDYIRKTVTEMVTSCPRSLFVFDEVDKIPAGLLDVFVSLFANEDANVNKAIFLFLGNAGADYINDITLKHMTTGGKREDLTIQHFHKILCNCAFDTDGGWYQSKMIEKIHIKWFIPFLPLERQHVLKCFRRQANELPGANVFSEEEFENMANQLTYWPSDTPLFSKTGCKRVENILLYEIEQRRYAKWEL